MKRLFFLTVISCVLILCAACSAEKAVDTKEPVKIGALLSLTGEYDQYGISIKDGIELAVSDINKKGGINGIDYSVIYEDSKSTVEDAKAGLDKLIAQGVQVVIGPEITEICEEIIPYAANKGIILVSPSATAPSLREKAVEAKGYFFRICASDESEAGQLAIDMVRSSRWKFIKRSYGRALVIVRQNNPYTEGLWHAFGTEINQKNVEYEIKRYDAEDVQALPEEGESYKGKTGEIIDIAKNYLRSPKDESKMGAIVIFGFANEVEFFLRAFKKEGLDVQVYTSSGVDTVEFIKTAKDVAAGIVFPRMFDSASTEEPIVINFVKAYETAYSKKPDLFAAYGFDAAMLLGLTIQRDGIQEAILEPYNFRMNMNDVKYHGVTGTVDFNNSTNEVNKTPALYKLEENGSATPIKEYEAKVLAEATKKLK